MAGAALYCSWGAGRRDVGGGWVLAAVGGAGVRVRSDECWTEVLGWGAGKGGWSSEMGDGPDTGVVLEVHVALATGAQACRDVFANVTGGGGEDSRVVCMNILSAR